MAAHARPAHNGPVRFSRWIDHLPPGLAFGAVASTGIFEPLELALMAWPLAAALLVEAQRWDLGRHRRRVEVGLLLLVLLMALARLGLVSTTLATLFLLCGARLSLPRELPQQRQILLMGFLAFLTTTVATFDLAFLGWALAWMGSAALVLLRQAWNGSAAHKGGLAPAPPYRKLVGWMAAALAGSALLFVLMPRPTLGLRFFPWGMAGLAGRSAGLSDRLDLEGGGPVVPNGEVVLRVIPGDQVPAGERPALAQALALLKGITLEELDGQTWEPARLRPHALPQALSEERWRQGISGPLRGYPLEFALNPDPMGVVPRPYGTLEVVPLPGMPLRPGPGSSLRWMFPSRRALSLKALLLPETEGPQRMAPDHRIYFTRTGAGTEAALRWSLATAPEPLPPSELVASLTAELSSWGYTLENPSGRAADPLRDFLERTRSGHCEYYASALALALRHRNVPARVVNGYRLGPWIPEGRYWVVTRNEAHSWVEWWDDARRRWTVADPTPAAPPSELLGEGLRARLQRWAEALRFHWDRYVVRFSDRDQQEGLAWLQDRAEALPGNLPSLRRSVPFLIGIGALLALAWALRQRLAAQATPGRTRALQALAPLVKAAGRDQAPSAPETLRAWLRRQAALRPHRQHALERLIAEAESVAYNNHPDRHLRHLVGEERQAWKQKR